MGPVNMFLSGDPLLGNSGNLEEQLRMAEAYQQKLKALQDMQSKAQQQAQPQQVQQQRLIWDDIDDEIAPLTNEQKMRLSQDADYMDTYNELQGLVQAEILSLVKGRIESTERGRDLLASQLKIVKRLKTKIIDDTNKEMEIFRRFREFSKQNPTVTYEEFIKDNM